MFTKLEQRSWLKLKQAGAKQQKSYRGLEEACGTAALLYRTVPGGFKPSTVDRSVRTINKTGAAKGIMRLPHHWERVYITLGSTSRVCENMNSVGVLYQKLQQRSQN